MCFPARISLEGNRFSPCNNFSTTPGRVLEEDIIQDFERMSMPRRQQYLALHFVGLERQNMIRGSRKDTKAKLLPADPEPEPKAPQYGAELALMKIEGFQAFNVAADKGGEEVLVGPSGNDGDEASDHGDEGDDQPFLDATEPRAFGKQLCRKQR